MLRIYDDILDWIEAITPLIRQMRVTIRIWRVS